jgi:hypothetical protein
MKVNKHLGESYRINIQGEESIKQKRTCWPEDGGDIFLQNDG